MANFMKKVNGERLKKMMQTGIRASRFTRLSKNFNSGLLGPGVREPTIIGRLSKTSNFDYLGLRDESNKLFKRVNLFLEKNMENKHSLTTFTDYMYRISSRLSKSKLILIVTQANLYSLSLNL